MKIRRESPLKHQGGFTLVELMIVGVIGMLLAIWAAGRLTAEMSDSQATATAKHLLAVKGATQSLVTQNFGLLSGHGLPPAHVGAEPPPAWMTPAWLASLTSGPQTIGLAELKAAGVLQTSFPDNPPLGGSTQVILQQEGTCPGPSCDISAIVFLTDPIRPRGNMTGYDPNLVGQFMMASDGFGGNSREGTADRIQGPLFNVPNPVGTVPGIVAVDASLNSTMFNQFVRQGDNRHIWLQDQLSVSGQMNTQGGLYMNTSVNPADNCPTSGLMAMTADGVLAQCIGSGAAARWLKLTGQVVRSHGLYPTGATIDSPECPVGTSPFAMASTANTDVTITGSNITVRGDLVGNVSGSGSVNSTGAVSVTGAVNGELISRPDSVIKIAQLATLSGPAEGPWFLTLSPADANARALVIAGCSLG